ncbi:MAG: 30S ribosomal protein S6 [Candidatus Kuenenia sp.]|nr:30S ribosomal protein S6 [Candidatus Kuenenia hertensis]
MRLYEGMFLIDNVPASADWDGVVKSIHGILEKNGAEILKTEKWGEKKLAYKIKGHKRGTYLLIHFNAESTSISPMKRDFQLSDFLIRFLILRDTVIEELSSAGIEGEPPEKETENAFEAEEEIISEEEPEAALATEKS